MDYKSAFAYVFEDPDWVKKILIGFALGLFFWLIIPALFIGGYYVKAIRNIVSGAERPLPEWDGWGSLLVSGLKLGAIFLVFGIVFILIAGVFLIPMMLSPNESTAIIFIVLFEISVIAINLIFTVFIPAITMQFGRRELIRDSFNFKQIIALIRSNPLEYLLVVLLGVAVDWVASLGLIALIIGIFITIFYSLLVKASLYGQYLRLVEQKTAEVNSLG